MLDHLMTPTDRMIQTMQHMNLIPPGLFDYFQTIILGWYYEEGEHDEEGIPNLWHLINNQSAQSQQILELFINGFALQYCEHHGISPLPGEEGFSEEDGEMFVNMYMQNIDSMRPLMVADVESVLNAFQVPYCFDPGDEYEENKFYRYQNSAVKGVW